MGFLRDKQETRNVGNAKYLSETQARVPNSVFLAKPFSLTELTATVQGQMH